MTQTGGGQLFFQLSENSEFMIRHVEGGQRNGFSILKEVVLSLNFFRVPRVFHVKQGGAFREFKPSYEALSPYFSCGFHSSFLNMRMGKKGGFNFPELNAMSGDFDLCVLASEKLQCSIRPITGHIACFVKAFSFLRQDEGVFCGYGIAFVAQS